MPTVITGTDGINQVQAGAVESGDLPAGSVIQVVQNSTKTETKTSSTNYVDTTLTGQITPFFSSSKILVQISPQFYAETTTKDFELSANITRNSISIKEFQRVLQLRAALNSGLQGSASIGLLSYLDSPASTSLLSYTLQIKVQDTTTSGRINKDDRPTSIITLMEIAA